MSDPTVTREEHFDAATWPRDPANGRLLCAPSKPMPPNAAGNWAHTSVEFVRSTDDFGTGQEFSYYRCKDCRTSWNEEVPQ